MIKHKYHYCSCFCKRKSFENDNDLGHYLAGLIEGDGHFSKHQLIISGHKNDLEVFESLVKAISYGTIRPYSSSANAPRFVICSKAGLKRVLTLINGKLVGEKNIIN